MIYNQYGAASDDQIVILSPFIKNSGRWLFLSAAQVLFSDSFLCIINCIAKWLRGTFHAAELQGAKEKN
ncbi:hypothetical protein ADH70_001415 [Blautia pseudococcoides]|uniref:Uncharacterized protein n=1 Tax=Blautia pseudococcoides TaxID=1796616 RepID=A0A1C7I9D8_9FIRM|nr:hypothetical protein A4V09_03090 [Blautia pseudococcoides]ASU27641.1 hypothetical protein ADH70_001415 [Blautia pseudococcoides]